MSPDTDRGSTTLEKPRLRASLDGYGTVLVALVASLIVMGLVSGHSAGRAITVLVFVIIFFLTIRASGVARRNILRLAAIIPVALVLGVLADVFGSTDIVAALSPTVSALFVIASMAFIVRRLATHRRITTRTVYGSLCIYLFVAILFAIIYLFIATVGDAPFFAQTQSPSGLDYIYFSFVTITTLGFGDLSPVNDLGRMTAVVEAVSGQLYLVVVVALFVGNLGFIRRSRDGNVNDADDADQANVDQEQMGDRVGQTEHDRSEPPKSPPAASP